MTSPVTTPDRRRWFALAIVMTAAFMDLVDVTIVNIAIPSIQRDAGATVSQIQWITAGYALAFAAGLITGGRLGDIYGRKRLFLIGIAGFTLASALCGFAANPEMLVASRILQGGMAAMMVPQVLSIVHATFPAEERGKVFGLFGMIVGLGAVSGPLLGALLTEWNLFGLEWRPIFLINLPVGIAGLLLGRRFISESKAPRALKLDLVGVVLVTLGLLMLIYPLTRGRELGWPVWGHVVMGCSVLVFGALVAYEKYKTRRDGSPLIELSLFKVKSFAAGVAVQVVFGVALGVFFLVWTMYMQVGLEVDGAARGPDRGAVLHRRVGGGRDLRAEARAEVRSQGAPDRRAGDDRRTADLHLGGRALRRRDHVLADGAAARRDGGRHGPHRRPADRRGALRRAA